MKPTRRLGAAGIAGILATVLAAAGAHADRAILLVGGELAIREGDAVRRAANRAVQDAGWHLVDSELSAQATARLLGCLHRDRDNRGGCLSEVFARTKVERALVVQATSTIDEGKRTRLLLAVVFRPSGKMLALEQRFCGRCDEGMLADAALIAVGRAIREARSQAAPSWLRVRSTPPGAQVILDGRVIGATEVEFRVYPGRHIVRLEKSGFASATREVSVDDGEHAVIDAPLVASAPTSAPADTNASTRQASRGKSRLVPWMLLGGGAAALATGGLLLAWDAGDRFDDGDRRQLKARDTTPYALGVGGAGILAVGAGIVLLLRSRATADGPAPFVSSSGEATWIGLRGSF
jgi:hypothetical protein